MLSLSGSSTALVLIEPHAFAIKNIFPLLARVVQADDIELVT